MFRSIQRIRHLPRYREIVLTFVRHGFGDLVNRLNLLEHLRIRQERFEDTALAHLDAPTRLRLALEHLGPTFIKLGQMLSTRPDVVPPEFLRQLEKLQDNAQPVAWEEIRAVIEQELSATLAEKFQSVDETPLAAASLAQVHSALLLDGTEVVLKVQRPRIDRLIQKDLEILADVAALVGGITPLGRLYDLSGIVEEFAYMLRMEQDYRIEGGHADTFRENFQHDRKVHIPKIYWEFATGRLLVMERLRGIKIDDVAALDAAGYNRSRLAESCARLIIKEVLIDGFFHADPHPGNLLVMPDEVIGVLDFGMVGWLETSMRLQVAHLYIQLVRRDIDGVVERLIQLGIASIDVDKKQLRHELTRLIRKYYGRSLKDVRTQELVGEITQIAFRHHLLIPTDLWLLLKTLVVMEGVGLRLDPTFDVFTVSQPIVRRLSWQLWSPARLLDTTTRTMGSLTDFMTETPAISLTLLRRLERGQLKIQIEPTEYERVLANLNLVVNRLSVSLLISSFILGLAFLLPRVESTDSWFFPVFVAMFIGAAALGIWLTYSMLRGSK